ncbi:C2 domain-containing protein 3, partial [Pseudolycoriella hygida]
DHNSGCPEMVLSWQKFWGLRAKPPSFTLFSHNINNVFEYLEMFEVDSPTFYHNFKNNWMDVKVWEKYEDSFRQLINIPLSLHPFFETFSNPKLADEFFKEKMPVASFTDWIDINVGSTVPTTLTAKLQLTLAIGTTDQLNAFKNNRDITVAPCTNGNLNPKTLAILFDEFLDNLITSSALRNPVPDLKTALSFKVRGEAANLPTVNRQQNKNLVHDRPSICVSFEAIDEDGHHYNVVSKAVQENCNLHWNEKFNVLLPKDLFQQNNKNFMLKILRKTTQQKSDDIQQDETVGVCTIDLSSLTNEFDISGYHNIVDTSGQCNGQIKINISLVDDNCLENRKNSADDTELPNNLQDFENESLNLILSRTLKRKFTELEEISQRLKSRLLDVTEDDNFDIDDEFEKQLNTRPVEDDADSADSFDWKRFSNLEIDCHINEPEMDAACDRLDRKADGDFSIPTNHSVLTTNNKETNNLVVDEQKSINVHTTE